MTLPLLKSLSLIFILSARAEEPQRGLVVHVNAGAEKLTATVTLKLVPDSGATAELTLNDDGAQPDVTAGDNVWSGFGMVAGASASATLTAATFTATGSGFPLATDKERNLDLDISAGKLVATVVASGPRPAIGTAPTAPAENQGVEPRPPTPPASPTQYPEADERPRSEPTKGIAPAPGSGERRGKSDTVLYIAFGIGALLLAALGYFGAARRSAAKDRSALPAGVQRAPERGYFGEGTPGLAPGVSQWVVTEADANALIDFLTGRLARVRPVLIHSAAPFEPRAIWGGRVYHANYPKPSALGDAAEAMLDSHPGLVMVVTGADADDLELWTAELPAELPIFAVVRASTGVPGPVVSCRRTLSGWSLVTGAGEVAVDDAAQAPAP